MYTSWFLVDFICKGFFFLFKKNKKFRGLFIIAWFIQEFKSCVVEAAEQWSSEKNEFVIFTIIWFVRGIKPRMLSNLLNNGVKKMGLFCHYLIGQGVKPRVLANYEMMVLWKGYIWGVIQAGWGYVNYDLMLTMKIKYKM